MRVNRVEEELNPSNVKPQGGGGLSQAYLETLQPKVAPTGVVQENPADAPATAPQEQASSYDYLRDLSAKDLMDSNVMLAVSNEAAKRKAQQQIAQSGLGSTGYGNTAMALLGNANNQGLMMNARAYQESLAKINQQEMESEEEANANRASIVISGIDQYAESPELLSKWLEENDFSLENGKISYHGKYNFTEEQLKDIQTAVNMLNVSRAVNYGVSGNGFSSPEEMLNSITITGGVSANAGRWGVSNEVYELFERFKDNPPVSGYVVRLTNGNSDNHTYVMYQDGKWYQTTEEAYSNAPAGSKTEIKGSSMQNSQYKWVEDESLSKVLDAESVRLNKKQITYQGKTYAKKDGKWYQV